VYAPSPVLALVRTPLRPKCGGALTSCSPFRGGASVMRSPSCSAVCSSQAGPRLPFHVCTQPRHALRSNAASFVAGGFSAQLAGLMLAVPSAVGAVPTAGSAPPRLWTSTTRGRLPSHLRWLSQPPPRFMRVNAQWVNFPRVGVGPSFVRVNTRGVDFPRIRVGVHNRTPHCCTCQCPRDPTSLVSASAFTAMQASPLALTLSTLPPAS
jgi:hypothetical protein